MLKLCTPLSQYKPSMLPINISWTKNPQRSSYHSLTATTLSSHIKLVDNDGAIFHRSRPSDTQKIGGPGAAVAAWSAAGVNYFGALALINFGIALGGLSRNVRFNRHGFAAPFRVFEGLCLQSFRGATFANFLKSYICKVFRELRLIVCNIV